MRFVSRRLRATGFSRAIPSKSAPFFHRVDGRFDDIEAGTVGGRDPEPIDAGVCDEVGDLAVDVRVAGAAIATVVGEVLCFTLCGIKDAATATLGTNSKDSAWEVREMNPAPTRPTPKSSDAILLSHG